MDRSLLSVQYYGVVYVHNFSFISLSVIIFLYWLVNKDFIRSVFDCPTNIHQRPFVNSPITFHHRFFVARPLLPKQSNSSRCLQRLRSHLLREE